MDDNPRKSRHRPSVLIGTATIAIAFLVWLPTSLSAEASESVATTGRPWVLLPLNVVDVPPEHLADGAEIFDRILAAELDARNISFIQLSLVDGLRRWASATLDVGGLKYNKEGLDTESFDRAQQKFLRTMIREFNATGVIWPDIHEREARKKSKSLTWDGTTQPIPGASQVRGAASPGVGSSLRLRMFDTTEALTFDAYHGVETIHRLQVMRKKRTSTMRTVWYEYLVRIDLFEDDQRLAKVAQALLSKGLP